MPSSHKKRTSRTKRQNSRYSSSESWKDIDIPIEGEDIPLQRNRRQDKKTSVARRSEHKRTQDRIRSFFSRLKRRGSSYGSNLFVFSGYTSNKKKRKRTQDRIRSFFSRLKQRGSSYNSNLFVFSGYTSNKKKRKFRFNLRHLRPASHQVVSRFAIFGIGVMLILLINPGSTYLTRLWELKDSMSLKMDAAHTLITNAAQNGEWGKVSTYLKTVRQEMNRARSTFPNENGLSGRVISFIPPGSLLTHAHSLVNRASQLSGYGADITEQMSPLTQNTPGTVLESEKTAHTLVNTAQTVHTHLPDITRTLKGTHTDLSQLPAWLLPASARQQVTRAREVIPAVNGLLADSRDYLNIFLEFAGQEYKRRYLFVFQNNQEVRATGGFIGTFGVMDVYQGEVERIDIQSIYDADGQLRENVVPPKPLQALTRRWHLRDANWFADFPTSAQRIIQFYEQTGGPTVDGVIALTPPIVRDLVEVVGPIEMPKYNTTVTAEKFVRIVQHETSIAYDKEKNDPKAFINDLAPKLLQRMFQADKDTYQELAQVIAKGARRKQMLLYAQEDSVQNTLEQYNLSGSVYKTKKDYLAVINSNIGGKKTDGVIEQRIKQNVSIREDGRVVSEVTVTRIHNGGNTKYPRWNAVNKDYMRIFVPQGSTLIEARGFDNYKLPKEREYTGAFETDSRLRAINQTRESHSKYHLTQSRQHKKTVFAGWTVTPPQKQSKVTLIYELPFKISTDKKDMYSLIVQKQAGTSGSRYELTVEYPSDYALPWHTSSFDTTTSESKIRARTILRTDQYLGTTFVP